MRTLELKGRLMNVIANINNEESLGILLKIALGLSSNEEDQFQIPVDWKSEIDRREEILETGSSTGRPLKDVLAKYKK